MRFLGYLCLVALFGSVISSCGPGFCGFVGCDGSSGGSGGGNDTDLGSSPTFSTGTGFDGNPNAVAVASDGSGDVYVGGAFSSYNGVDSANLLRLNADGSFDSGFAVGAFNGIVRSIAIDTDGSGIYVAGDFTTYAGVNAAHIVRIDTEGDRDPTFNSTVGVNGVISDVAIDSNRQILAVGDFTMHGATPVGRVVRLNTDATRDGAFAVGNGFETSARALAVDDPDTVYVAGVFETYQAQIFERVVRLASNGGPNLAFNVIGALAGFNDTTSAVAVANDGSFDVYFGGDFTTFATQISTRLVRLNSDGSRDAGFAASVDSPVLSLLFTGNQLYVGGTFNSVNAIGASRIARLNSDAALDLSFATGTGFNGNVIDMSARGNGDIYVVGAFSTYNGGAAGGIVRLNSDGSRD